MNALKNSNFGRALTDGVRQLCSRAIYPLMMVVVPLAVAFFMLSLMDEGLPLKLPSAVVDLDHSPVSRRVVRNLGASELTDIKYKTESYAEAMDLVKNGTVYGFFLIPRGFQADAEAGRPTTITFYTNMAYFVPGSLSYKSFKTVAVTTSGVIAATSLTEAGMSQSFVSTMIQPVVTQVHPLGNPWSNYSIYLSNSFLPCLLQLIVMQITVFSILQEIKRATSVAWIRRAGGSILTACAGKLIPQFVIFTIVGLAIQGMLYGLWGFPLQGSVAAMAVAMMLLVGASQAFALTVAALVPNLRLALSIVSLTGILAFSIAGFSFPVEEMYPAVGIFASILPVRYYFLIYINVALNGYPAYFVRWEYVGLMIFLIVPFIALWRLRRYAVKPEYIP